jgi:mRNA (guanine-N7-)-methyltransferase
MKRKNSSDDKQQEEDDEWAPPQQQQQQQQRTNSQEEDSSEEDQDQQQAQQATAQAAAPPGTTGSTLEVASHYSAMPNTTPHARTASAIIGLRKFNNWVKATLAELYCGSDGGATVLELCGGKGGDLGKWEKRGARHVVLVDVALESVRQATERYAGLLDAARHRASQAQARRMFTATFVCADCFRVDLARHLPAGLCFDVVSCQFALHYSFESEAAARGLLANAAARLRPGGWLVGTVPNADALYGLLRSAPGLEFGNSVYRVRFDQKAECPRFGWRYTFFLRDAVAGVPEFMVHFPTLVRLAADYGLLPELDSPFPKFRDELTRQHPRFAESLARATRGAPMSPDEEAVAALYRVFVFRKQKLPPPPYSHDSILVIPTPTSK